MIATQSVGLSCASLSIDKDTAIITLKCVDEQLFPNSIIDIFLIGSGREDAIESKSMFFQFDLTRGVDDSLIIRARFDSNEYLNGIFSGDLLWIHFLTVIIFEFEIYRHLFIVRILSGEQTMFSEKVENKYF